MRLPRDVSGDQLINALSRVDYYPTRQKGSHVRISTTVNGKHSVTVPRADPLPMGTFSDILGDVAEHLMMPRDELLRRLFE